MHAIEKNEETSKVIVKRLIAAERERVFDAWTKPELMNQWYVGGKGSAKCTVDLKVGGKYTNEMFIEGESTCTAEGKSTDESKIKSYMHEGEYLEIKRPDRLVFTWNSPSVKNTKVTVEFRPVGSETEVTITHELLPESQIHGHTDGWSYALGQLAGYLA